MKPSKNFHDYVMGDVFSAIPGVTSRAMFGGYGIYKDGIIFAIIAKGVLYFKADEKTQKEFKKFGSEPFVYMSHGNKLMTMSYWQLPEEVMEDHMQLEEWVKRAVESSIASKNTKKGKKYAKK